MATQILNIILYSLTTLASVIEVCVSIYVLILMRVRRLITKQHPIDYLLYANTYCASFFVSIFYIDMCAYFIYGNIYVGISFNGWWCKTKGYLWYISGIIFFYTFALQAFYRFCCILYRTHASLHSVRLYKILSVGLWLLIILELLPSFLVGDIEYILNDYHCQFAPTSLRGSFTIYSVGFLLPFSVTVFCYIWAMRTVRKQNAALVTINQQANMRRDIIILEHLAIFLSIVALIAAPHIYLPIINLIIGYLPLWIISLEWLLTSLALLAVSIILLHISPHLKKLRPGLHAVHPVETIETITRRRQ